MKPPPLSKVPESGTTQARSRAAASSHGEHSRYNEHQPNWNFHDGSLLHLRLHVDLFVKQSLPVRWNASGRSPHRLI